MLKYEKLPKTISPAMKGGIWLVGICLAYGLVVNAIIALYGLTGFLVSYFFPLNALAISSSEGVFFGLLGLIAGITTTMLGFLAFYFNRLSKNAQPLSKIVFIPLAVVTILLAWQRNSSYHMSTSWLWASLIGVAIAGIIPALFLLLPSARRLHSR